MDIFLVNGLPLHILLVHLVVILIPATAVAIVLAALWPAARRRLGFVLALMGAVVIGIVPLTKEAGEWLLARVQPAPLIAKHVDLGNALVPWAVALGILGIATWLWYFALDRSRSRRRPGRGARRAAAVVIAVLALGIGGVATWQTVLVGEAGSRAVWQGSFSETPLR